MTLGHSPINLHYIDREDESDLFLSPEDQRIKSHLNRDEKDLVVIFLIKDPSSLRASNGIVVQCK